MKPIAIHDGDCWTSLWLEYCREKQIPHKVVCGYDSDILEQIQETSGFLWHINHWYPVDMLMGRHVLNAAEAMGLKVYPNFSTNWHFDDKVAQKYLFEATSAPAVKSWVFYNKKEALDFAKQCKLPIVAKLRRGAGSYNVRLLKTRSEVRHYIRRMFGKGFSSAPSLLADAKNKLAVAASNGGISGIWQRLKKAPRFYKVMFAAKKGLFREKGYVYFQEFIPENSFDVRVSVIGNRAWAYKRLCRKGDFRASGSGMIDYDVSNVPLKVIEASFETANKMNTQSICFDWILCPDGEYRFVEVSFGFVDVLVHRVPGYWDRSLGWHEGNFHPSWCVLEDFLQNEDGNHSLQKSL